MRRHRVLLLAIATAVLFGATSLNAQISTQVAVCGRVDAFVPASAIAAGSVTISGKPFVISAGTQLTNQSALVTGANVCLTASANALGQIVAPATVTANVNTTLSVCGVVESYTAATAVSAGLLRIAGRALTIAAGTNVENDGILSAGADACVRATLNGLAQVVVPTTASANVKSTVSVCGVVEAYAAATAASDGALRIAGRDFVIAAGTAIEGAGLLTAGASLCLNATLDGLARIVVPSSVTAAASTTLRLCGTVEAYTAATANANGSLTLAGRTLTIVAGTTISNAGLLQVGADLCLDATLDASGRIISPASVTASVTSSLTLCGRVQAYTAATVSAPGSITFDGGRTLAIAAGTSITGASQIVAGAHLCLEATVNAAGQAVNPTSVAATARVRICGEVNVYTAATSNAKGSITIDGRSYSIAAGTTIVNAAEIQVGLRICLDATVDIIGDIIPPTAVDENHPPSLTVPGPQTVRTVTTLRFSVSASDPDQGDSVQITAAELPPHASFAGQPGNPATAEVAFTPDPSQAGQTFTVTFTARDGKGGEDADQVRITVTGEDAAGNQPPRITVPGPQTVSVNTTLRFTVTATDSDPDTVSIRASGLPDGAVFTPSDGNPASGELRFTPRADQGGHSFIVTFIADDGRGHTASDSVVIRVTSPDGSVNRPPILSLPGPQLIAPNETLTFRVVGRDPEGGVVTLSSGPLPPKATFDPGTGLFRMTPDDDQLGREFICDFFATDPEGEKTGGNVRITVVQRRDGTPPILSVPPSPISVIVGDPLIFTVVGTPQMPDCDVTLGARGIPANATFDASSGRFHFVPSQAQVNLSFHVEFSAADCDDRTTRRIITILVVPRGDGNGPDGGNPPGQACLGITDIVFSPADEFSCSTAIVTLTNRGRGRLTIRSMTIDHPAFVLNNDWPGAVLLPPGMSLPIEIRHLGEVNGGAAAGTLTIETDDPTGGTLTLRMRRQGAKRRSSN